MFRLLGLLLLAPAFLLAADDTPAPGKARLDPDKAFRRGDTNKDGKLSRAEFRRLLASAPRFKDNPEAISGRQLSRALHVDNHTVEDVRKFLIDQGSIALRPI